MHEDNFFFAVFAEIYLVILLFRYSSSKLSVLILILLTVNCRKKSVLIRYKGSTE